MNELPQERLLVANMAIASAEACFEWTRSYVKDRKVCRCCAFKCMLILFFTGYAIFDLFYMLTPVAYYNLNSS